MSKENFFLVSILLISLYICIQLIKQKLNFENRAKSINKSEKSFMDIPRVFVSQETKEKLINLHFIQLTSVYSNHDEKYNSAVSDLHTVSGII